MANIYRLKHSFTSGELSPLMNARLDFDRYKTGSRLIRNMVCLSQGPVTRRPGTRFIYDLNALGIEPGVPHVRMVPFIFNERQAYVMIFFRGTDGKDRVVFATGEGLVVYPAKAPDEDYECPEGTPLDPQPNEGDIVSLDLPDGWDNTGFDWAQTADEMYFAQSGLEPHIIKRHSHECWELVSVTFTDQPDDWSDANGWPETVTFHQQRLVFGANKLRRQTVWMSMAGDFSSFHVDNSNLTDDMAVTFTLDSGTQNKIQWLSSGKGLYIGTLGDEWIVTGSSQPALTPKNIYSQKQTNTGSERLKPVVINFTTMYLALHGRQINEFVYDYIREGYTSNDLSVLAPHLTEHNSIIDWDFQPVPHGLLWCVRDDGALITLTYQRQHKVVGWHRHETDGMFETVSVIPGESREDEVWFIVRRYINGGFHHYIEKLDSFFTDDSVEYARFMDSFSEYIGGPTDNLQGLDHLENETVSIIADGTVHPDRTVSGGKIVLNAEYSVIGVGLPYVSEVWPYLMDTPTQSGTAFTRTQRAVKLNVDFYNSLGVWVGRNDSEDGEYEEEVPFRVPADLTGKPVPLFTGIYSIDFPVGFDRDLQYFIRQKQPLPLTVRGIVDVTEVNR